MAKSSTFLVLLVLAFVGLLELKVALAILSPAQCKEGRRIGLNECKPVLYGKLPTPSCCALVRASPSECICPIVTPRLAALIDLNRAIQLIEGCGRRVPRHYKCGSITTP